MISTGKLGPFNLFALPTGDFRLDGGAMFGVVPKTLWSKRMPADDLNRIEMGMRCLLIQSENTDRVYLVDCGIGKKYDEKFKKIYAFDDEGKDLTTSILKAGFQPDDITDVIFTHLHFDHGGGAVVRNEDGTLGLQFPKAKHWITKEHWETATIPNAREKASFLPDNIEPLKGISSLKFTSEKFEFEKGLDVLVMNGHTKGQQLPRLSWNGTTVVFMADLLPTASHMPLAWVMGYDMNPLQTLVEKEAFLKEAYEKEWFLFLEHDSTNEIIKVQYNGKNFESELGYTLSHLK